MDWLEELRERETLDEVREECDRTVRKIRSLYRACRHRERDLINEINWLNAELHGAELEALKAELGAVAMTEENMAAHGWVRERTCEFVSRDRPPRGFIWVCSNCDTPTTGYGHLDWLYCPECGAKAVRDEDAL